MPFCRAVNSICQSTVRNDSPIITDCNNVEECYLMLKTYTIICWLKGMQVAGFKCYSSAETKCECVDRRHRVLLDQQRGSVTAAPWSKTDK